MPVPSSISDLSQTANSNSPAGSESPNTADDYLRTLSAFIATLRDGKGFTDPTTLASGATTDIGAENAMFVQITGTTTITSFGTNYNGPRFLRFTGALTLTHNATTLNLPGGANITTAAGDTCIAIPNSTPNGWNVVQYQLAALAPGVANTATSATSATTATSAATVTTTVASGATGTTQSANDNSTKIATTAYVDAAAAVAAASGAFVLLGSQTASSSASVSFTSLMSSTYDDYIVKILNAVPATSGQLLVMRMSVNNGSSYFSTAGDYAHSSNGIDPSLTARSAGSGSDTSINIGGFPGTLGLSNTAADAGWSGTVELFKTNTTNQKKLVATNGVAAMTGPVTSTQVGMGVGVGASNGIRDAAVNAIQFLMTSGNIASGNFYLYGVKKS